MTTNQLKQDALLDELLRDCTDPKDILGEHGLLKQLQKRLIERVLAAELTDHLGDESSARSRGGRNRRNGKVKKLIQTDRAQFEIGGLRIASWLAWMDSTTCPKPLRRSSPKPRCSCASSIRCATRSSMSPGRSVNRSANLRAVYALPRRGRERLLEAFCERWDAQYPAIGPS